MGVKLSDRIPFRAVPATHVRGSLLLGLPADSGRERLSRWRLRYRYVARATALSTATSAAGRYGPGAGGPGQLALAWQ